MSDKPELAPKNGVLLGKRDGLGFGTPPCSGVAWRSSTPHRAAARAGGRNKQHNEQGESRICGKHRAALRSTRSARSFGQRRAAHPAVHARTSFLDGVW